MASSLEELIEEWEKMRYTKQRDLGLIENEVYYRAIARCISDLRDTLLVMEADEVRKCATPRE